MEIQPLLIKLHQFAYTPAKFSSKFKYPAGNLPTPQYELGIK
jgi:hypothetical protein